MLIINLFRFHFHLQNQHWIFSELVYFIFSINIICLHLHRSSALRILDFSLSASICLRLFIIHIFSVCSINISLVYSILFAVFIFASIYFVGNFCTNTFYEMCPHRRRISGLGILRSAGKLAPVAFAENKHIHRHKYLWKDTTQLYVKIYEYALKEHIQRLSGLMLSRHIIFFETRWSGAFGPVFPSKSWSRIRSWGA